MVDSFQKEIRTKLTKGLLDMIILQFLEQEPMHGYQIITKIRKGFGVYFGPSTVYPLLGALEKKGYVKSSWKMNAERPRRVYELTNNGQMILNFTQGSLNLICKSIANDNNIKLETNILHSTELGISHKTISKGTQKTRRTLSSV